MRGSLFTGCCIACAVVLGGPFGSTWLRSNKHQRFSRVAVRTTRDSLAWPPSLHKVVAQETDSCVHIMEGRDVAQ